MKRCQEGFTLIELLVTIVVVGILAAAAAPAFSSLIKENRLVTTTNDLKTDLALARSESSKRGVRVSICISGDGASCSGNDWASGRIVFVDRNANGTVDPEDEVLRVTARLPVNSKVTSNFTNANFVQYRPSGLADSVGMFKLCDDRLASVGRTIAVNAAGRANLTNKVPCP